MSRIHDALRRGRTTAALRGPSQTAHADAVLAALGYRPAKRRGRSLLIAVVGLMVAGATGWALWRLPSRIEARGAKAGAPDAFAVLQPARTTPVTPRLPAPPQTQVPPEAAPPLPPAPAPEQKPVVAPSAPQGPVATATSIGSGRPSSVPGAIRDAGVGTQRDDFQLALYHQRAGDFEQALLHYKAALRRDEMNVEAHNNLGSLYLGRNLYDEAAREFQRVLAIDPAYLPARINLSAILYQQGRFDAAASQARQVLRIDPRNVDGLVNLALAQKAAGQPGDSQDSLRRALELNPRHGIAHYNLARQYEETGEVARALEHYRHFLQYAGAEHEAHAADVRARMQSLHGRAVK